MMRAWFAVALLAGSWLLGLGYFDAGPGLGAAVWRGGCNATGKKKALDRHQHDDRCQGSDDEAVESAAGLRSDGLAAVDFGLELQA